MSNTAIGGVAAIATSAVEAAVRLASQRTGVDFAFLISQARLESGLNPNAHSSASSAAGLFQFTSATWLETVRKHGAAHGLEWAATALKDGITGLGQQARAAILALRNDAAASANMAAEFASDNQDILEKRLGRAVGSTELYLAHLLGASGATRFLQARDRNADSNAAAVSPGAAAANRSIFYARDGRARSTDEVFERFAANFKAVEYAPRRVTPTPVSVGNMAPPRGKSLPQPGDLLPVAPLTTQQLNQREMVLAQMQQSGTAHPSRASALAAYLSANGAGN